MVENPRRRLRAWWERIIAGRPWWMTAMMLFSAFMAAIYVPWDLLWKPVAEDEEVWLGIVLHGWAAKATEPIHLAIYAAGAWGFWRMRPWMHPWAAVYVAQIGVAMFVWPLLDGRGPGRWSGVLAALPFAALAVLLWRRAPLFRAGAGGSEPG